MLKKIIIFSFTKGDDKILLFVISCNLFALESLLSNMIFPISSLLLSTLSPGERVTEVREVIEVREIREVRGVIEVR